MAKIVLVCPFCQEKLETADGNIGRDGQCPHCKEVFEIKPQTQPGAVSAPSTEYEYLDNNTLAAIFAVMLTLVLLMLSTFVRWVGYHASLGNYITGVKSAVFGVSLACCAFFAFSLVGRKSLMPAVIVSGAWGLCVAVWTWGIRFFVGRAAAGADGVLQTALAAKAGLLLALLAGLLVCGTAVFVYSQARVRASYEKLGVCMLAAVLGATILGMLLISMQVRPTVARIAEATPAGGESEPDADGPQGAVEPGPPPEPDKQPDTEPAENVEPPEPVEPAPKPVEPPEPPQREPQPEPEPDPDAVPFIPADEGMRGPE